MLIIGCDIHSRFQQIAMLDRQTGELVERRLEHKAGEARAFYAALPVPARAGWKRLVTVNGLKQGNSMLRFLLVEAAQTASRLDPELRRAYRRIKFRRGSAVAKAAIARKLAVRLYWKLRELAPPSAAGSHTGQPGDFRGGPRSIAKMVERSASPGN